MSKKSSIKNVLIDLDGIVVDMLDAWLRQYAVITGEWVDHKTVTDWDASNFVKHPKLLNSLLDKPGFFRNLPIMNGAEKYLSAIMQNKKYNVFILTQPPRKAEAAVKDKGAWIKDYFPDFDHSNIIYAHKKHMVMGDFLFDDRGTNLVYWKMTNPKGKTVTIDYPYNKDYKVDYRFKKESAWKDFYELLG